MQSLMTLGEVNQILENRQMNLYDEIHPASKINFHSFDEVEVDGRVCNMTPSAQRLFAQRLQVPLEYISRCPDHLQEVNLNHWIKTLGDTRLFIRFNRDKVRAVFTTRYKPIDHVDVVRRMKQTLTEDTEVMFSLSDELLMITITEYQRIFNINGDEITPGIAIINSETGWSAFSIEAYFLRLVCTNGLISETKVSNRIRHIRENALNNLEDMIRLVSLEAEKIQEKLRISIDQEVDDPLATINNFSHRFGLTKKEGELIIQSWDGGNTVFSVINAYTAAANVPDLSLENRYKFQRIGGMILSMVK